MADLLDYYIEQLEKEYAEVNLKHEKLYKMIDGLVTQEHIVIFCSTELLNKQLYILSEYCEVLEDRINEAKNLQKKERGEDGAL